MTVSIIVKNMSLLKLDLLGSLEILLFSVAKASLHFTNVRLSVCLLVWQLVTKTPQQLEIIILHHSSFILHHPSSFFIHPSFISRLLSFSACLFRKANQYQSQFLSGMLEGLLNESWQQDPMLLSNLLFRVKPNWRYKCLDDNFLLLDNNTNAREHKYCDQVK